MKRRDAMKLFPLSLAGAAGMAKQAVGGEINYLNNPDINAQGLTGSGEPLAVTYSKRARERINWIRENQSDNLLEAAYAIARTVKNGGQCYQRGWDAGHSSADSWPGRNGEPEIFSTNFDINKLKKGDLLLSSADGFEYKPEDLKGAFVIGCPGPWSGDAKYPELLRKTPDDISRFKLRPYADLYIENNATALGGVVYVEGMPAPFGPVSGFTGKTTIWMILADACRILARDGINRPVKGDEPLLKENFDYKNYQGVMTLKVERRSLNKPLMGSYFNELSQQLDMVFAEYGTMKKVASMCVDSLMKHGVIYGTGPLAGEAGGRRSGLCVTESARLNTDEARKNFKGTSNDCAILGVTKPDDPNDLANLDLFRSRGMNVACIGPMTRSIMIPEGRTVQKESDFNLGRMCDTYGLFAIPGFERRICPTSGVLLDHLYWCTMLEVVQQYIERSGGDVPGAYFSQALQDGNEWKLRLYELYMRRP